MLAARLQLTEEAYERQVANGKMSPATLAGYVKAIHSERMQTFVAGRALASVKPSELREFAGGIEGTAKHVRNLLTPLRATFADALNDDLITFNPFDRIDMTSLLKRTTKDSDYEADPFTEQERAAILVAARPDEAPMIRFWLNAGPRPGELIAFKWPKVDFTNRKARIDLNQVVGVEKAPKTAAGVREVDLNDEAIAALIAQKPISFEAGGHRLAQPAHGKAVEHRRPGAQDAMAAAARAGWRAVPQPLPVPAHLRECPAHGRAEPVVRRRPARACGRADGLPNLWQVHCPGLSEAEGAANAPGRGPLTGKAFGRALPSAW